MLAMLARATIALLLIGALPLVDAAAARKARHHRSHAATESADKPPRRTRKARAPTAQSISSTAPSTGGSRASVGAAEPSFSGFARQPDMSQTRHQTPRMTHLRHWSIAQ